MKHKAKMVHYNALLGVSQSSEQEPYRSVQFQSLALAGEALLIPNSCASAVIS